MARIALLLPLLVSGCAAAWHDDYDRLAMSVARLDAVTRIEEPPRTVSTDADLDRQLSQPLELELLIEVARARNPELREAASRTRAGIAEVRRAGSLDDPMLKLQTEGVPLRHPASLNQAMDNMVGLSQTFPFPGNLSLRSEAALRDAEGMHEMYRDRERELILRLKKAYFEYYALIRELETHNEHVKLMEAFEKISDAKFRTGIASQQDVLKPQVEQVMLHNEVLTAAQRLGSVRAQINLLLHRPAEAPLGDPKEIVPADETFDVAALTARAAETRPDLKAAALRVRASQTALRLAERERSLPDFSVGVDYWQVPGGPDAYGAMFSINLPWFTGKRTAEASRLEHQVRADEAALDAARARAQFEVRDAWLRVDAARKSVAIFRNELLPKTAQTVEISRASYEKEKSSFLDLLDAERSLRDVKLKHIQSVAQYEAAVADLERAVGADLRRKP